MLIPAVTTGEIKRELTNECIINNHLSQTSHFPMNVNFFGSVYKVMALFKISTLNKAPLKCILLEHAWPQLKSDTNMHDLILQKYAYILHPTILKMLILI